MRYHPFESIARPVRQLNEAREGSLIHHTTVKVGSLRHFNQMSLHFCGKKVIHTPGWYKHSISLSFFN